MRRILLLSHGGLAKGMLNTLSLFAGENKNITAISAYVDGCEPKPALEKFWRSVNEEDQVLIFTDIMGGSVNQLVMPALSRPNTYIFSGMNLPMLIQASCLSEDAEIQDFYQILDTAREGVVFMNEYQMPEMSDDDE